YYYINSQQTPQVLMQYYFNIIVLLRAYLKIETVSYKMFSLSFTRVVHETLAVETETETFLIRDETEMRRHEGVHEAGFRGGRANGPSLRPLPRRGPASVGATRLS